MDEGPLLSVVDIRKAYSGVEALAGATFDLRAGEVHALIGENGAGKSTLVKVITGAVKADDGKVIVRGASLAENSPSIAKSSGIAAIYQQPALFPELTVSENIAIGQEGHRAWSRIRWNSRRIRARELLSKIGARIDPDREAGDLSMPQQQLVEIARALGAEARILIFDEPTASLSEDDTQNLFKVIEGLRDQGVGIIYISHRLEELSVIADRVTVLRDGLTVSTARMSEVSREQLIQQMVGRELSGVFPGRQSEPGEVTLKLRDLGCSSTGISKVDLELRAGEILGLAGLVGSGRTELARILFGLTPADRGEISILGRSVTIDSPTTAIESGIAYLPEDRRQHGVIPEMGVAENIALGSLNKLSKPWGFDFQRERQLAADYVDQFAIKTSAVYSAVNTLSGGNQQKVALSRWLALNPSVLILDEPTQGIDIGAKFEIHSLMNELAKRGVAILMISSDLPEILGMSDRIAVMQRGTIVGVLDRNDATQEKVLSLALGHFDGERAQNANG